MAEEPEKPKDPDGDRLSFIGRSGALISGFALIGLGAIDAVFDPFPGPETALFTAGIALVAIGATGRKPEKKP